MRIKKEHFIKKKHYYIAVFLDFLAFPFACLSRNRANDDSLANPKKILLIGHHHVGDLLFITPLLAALRSKHTKEDIYVTCPKNFRDILKNSPNVDGFIDFGESDAGILSRFIELMNTVIRIRREGFDLGISYNTDQLAINHLVLFLSGIKRRIGYGHKGLSFLLNDIVPFEGTKIIIEEYLDFARHLGIEAAFSVPEIYLTGAEIKEGESIVANLGLRPGVPVIGISPKAVHLFLWNDPDWAELCKRLRAEYNAEIVLMGSTSAIGMIKAIREQLDFKTHTLAGRTTIRQETVVINKLDLLVSLDTGTRHIAAAEGTPVVFLRHGSNDNVELGPYGNDHFMVCNEVPCAPCGDAVCRYNTYACVRNITVETVFDMIKNNVGSWIPDRSSVV